MGVIIDTNVFLSYMLAPAAQGAVAVVVTTCLTLDEIDLLIPPDQRTELAAKAAIKQYFRSRIPQKLLHRTRPIVQHVGIEVGAIGPDWPMHPAPFGFSCAHEANRTARLPSRN